MQGLTILCAHSEIVAVMLTPRQVLGSACALEMCNYVGVREAGTEGLIAEGYSVRRDRGTEDLGRQTTVPC